MNSRLRLATRIHFALRRRYGETAEVADLLRGAASAQEALWVCDASGDIELTLWARQLRTLIAQPDLSRTLAEEDKALLNSTAAQAVATEPEAAPADMAWSADTSGFGLYGPPVDLELPIEAPAKPAAASFIPFRRSTIPRKTT